MPLHRRVTAIEGPLSNQILLDPLGREAGRSRGFNRCAKRSQSLRRARDAVAGDGRFPVCILAGFDTSISAAEALASRPARCKMAGFGRLVQSAVAPARERTEVCRPIQSSQSGLQPRPNEQVRQPSGGGGYQSPVFSLRRRAVLSTCVGWTGCRCVAQRGWKTGFGGGCPQRLRQ